MHARFAVALVVATVLVSGSTAVAGGPNYVEVVVVTDRAFHEFRGDDTEAAAQQLILIAASYFADSSSAPFTIVHAGTVVLDTDPWTVPDDGSGQVGTLARVTSNSSESRPGGRGRPGLGSRPG